MLFHSDLSFHLNFREVILNRRIIIFVTHWLRSLFHQMGKMTINFTPNIWIFWNLWESCQVRFKNNNSQLHNVVDAVPIMALSKLLWVVIKTLSVQVILSTLQELLIIQEENKILPTVMSTLKTWDGKFPQVELSEWIQSLKINYLWFPNLSEKAKPNNFHFQQRFLMV